MSLRITELLQLLNNSSCHKTFDLLNEIIKFLRFAFLRSKTFFSRHYGLVFVYNSSLPCCGYHFLMTLRAFCHLIVHILRPSPIKSIILSSQSFVNSSKDYEPETLQLLQVAVCFMKSKPTTREAIKAIVLYDKILTRIPSVHNHALIDCTTVAFTELGTFQA